MRSLRRIKLNLVFLIIGIIISGIIIQQSVFLRWFGYETTPNPTTDEYNYVWQGLSLRQTGLPLGWVTFTYVYKNPSYQTRGGNLNGFAMSIGGQTIDLNNFKTDPKPIVAIEQIDYLKGPEQMFFASPFFDHPPLGGLIYSLGENTSQVKTVEQVKPAEFRRPALALALITAVLLFIFLYLITLNPWIATLGVIIYSTVPTYLLATRTAFLENVEPPFVLVHLILLFLVLKAWQKGWAKASTFALIILSGLIGGLAILTKEPAAGFLIGSALILILNKLPKKLIVIFCCSAAIPVLGYLSWGLSIHPQLFLEILHANSSRDYFGAIKPVTMLEALKFKNFPVDGWWIWGFISFIIISLDIKQKNLLFLVLPLFTHFLFTLLLSSVNYPWYLISMIPFLAGCSAVAIWQIYEKPNVATAFTFFLVAFSSSYYWGRTSLNLTPNINHYRLTFVIFSLFLAIRIFFGKYRLTHLIWFIFLAILIRKVIIYHQLFMPYLIAHWGNLPVPSLPGY